MSSHLKNIFWNVWIHTSKVWKNNKLPDLGNQFKSAGIAVMLRSHLQEVMALLDPGNVSVYTLQNFPWSEAEKSLKILTFVDLLRLFAETKKVFNLSLTPPKPIHQPIPQACGGSSSHSKHFKADFNRYPKSSSTLEGCLVVSGSLNRWDRWIYNPRIGSIYHLYTRYALPIGWLYATDPTY